MVDMTNLCKPSEYYLVFSVVMLLLMITFNIITGSKCGTVSNTFTFMTQLFYILFWTWILNKICQKGYQKFSWFLFLVPIVSSAVFVSVVTMAMVLGEDLYTVLEEEKAKEEAKNEERNETETETEPEPDSATTTAETFLNLAYINNKRR
jgi:hypothetical protein